MVRKWESLLPLHSLLRQIFVPTPIYNYVRSECAKALCARTLAMQASCMQTLPLPKIGYQILVSNTVEPPKM